ncbi:hypothetical protein BD779DRAFT_1668189 [Infundibulicybe gibba]|nr:hypothetical protein BD779DRAFT_1668189 [Infundibulicybe gibba]
MSARQAPPDYESRHDASSEPQINFPTTDAGRSRAPSLGEMPVTASHATLRSTPGRRLAAPSTMFSDFFAVPRPSSLTMLSGRESNYVALSRTLRPRLLSTSMFKGAFTVNPYLHIPATLLAPLANGESEADRKNLKIEVNGGGIDVNVALVGRITAEEFAERDTRVSLRLVRHKDTHNGYPLIARLESPYGERPPLRLSARGMDGYLSIHLPHDYRGLLAIHVAAGDLDGHTSLSRELDARAHILSETQTQRSYFVGDLGGWSKTEQRWEGDRATLVTDNGFVRVQMVGEKSADGWRRWKWGVGMAMQSGTPGASSAMASGRVSPGNEGAMSRQVSQAGRLRRGHASTTRRQPDLGIPE